MEISRKSHLQQTHACSNPGTEAQARQSDVDKYLTILTRIDIIPAAMHSAKTYIRHLFRYGQFPMV